MSTRTRNAHQVAQTCMPLEQQRAKDAWEKCADYTKEHVNVAKALPGLIMNSGLMQTLAFCKQKGDKYETIAQQMRQWLCGRFAALQGRVQFEQFMQTLMHMNPRDFQAITAEAFAWLKWLRQMASARKGGN